MKVCGVRCTWDGGACTERDCGAGVVLAVAGCAVSQWSSPGLWACRLRVEASMLARFPDTQFGYDD